MKTLIKIMSACTLTAFLAACGGDDDNNNTNTPDTPNPTATPAPFASVVDVAVDSGEFPTLVAALQAADLDEVLANEEGEFTVFAPSEEAFALFLAEQGLTAEALLASDALSDILLYHVVSGAVINSDAAISAAGSTVGMANEEAVGVSLEGDALYINLSQVVQANIEADNGIIHVIDRVLLPPSSPLDEDTSALTIAEIVTELATAESDPEFTTLLAALGATGLDDTLNGAGTYTVFAPTDEAFEVLGAANVEALVGQTSLLREILLTHVIGRRVESPTAFSLNGLDATMVSGDDVRVDIFDRKLRFGGAEVIFTDIPASNGVIHVIDMVIVGENDLPEPSSSIADIVVDAASADENAEFTILLQALQTADLASALDTGTYTVFAPTDAAFAALLTDLGITAEQLLESDNLADILLYHVVGDARILADTAVSVAYSDMPMVEMANEDSVTLSESDEFYINTSAVVQPNVIAANGVIHVIDKVLLPPTEMGEPMANIAETVIAATQADEPEFTVLLDAVVAAGFDTVLENEEETFTVFAPTDAAFTTLLGDLEITAEELLANTELLTSVLSLHVIQGAAADSVSAYTLNGKTATTLGGQVNVDIVAGNLIVGGSTVVTTDIYTNNGVIHVIDAVITEAAE